ncbi:MAG: hypothetical protein A2X99_08535 [Deltaproteobacteria bacterium GWB2_55_19]|nr:MAG: hypothetical protein A2X99_08535 [Deltaproteobacteria bacterium GWB2_55_19]
MKRLLSLLFFLAIIIFPASTIAAEAAIAGVNVDLDPLRVSFEVRDAFTVDIEEAVKSGLPTSFNFIVRLSRVNPVWIDEDIGKWEFRHTVKYDTLKEEYEVRLDEGLIREARTKDFEEMKSFMSRGEAIAITPAHLVPGEVYELSIKAELDKTELPPLLDYMFFFVKLWDFETDWHVYRFSP